MSRVNDEKKYKYSTKEVQPSPRKPRSRYVVFRPNEAERKEIKALEGTYEFILGWIARRVQSDAKLTIGYKAENSAYFVHLTDLGVAWQEAVTLSVWHGDLATALKSMCYGLSGKYSEFPDIQLELFSDELEW